jgi:hypothetical protein
MLAENLTLKSRFQGKFRPHEYKKSENVCQAFEGKKHPWSLVIVVKSAYV